MQKLSPHVVAWNSWHVICTKLTTQTDRVFTYTCTHQEIEASGRKHIRTYLHFMLSGVSVPQELPPMTKTALTTQAQKMGQAKSRGVWLPIPTPPWISPWKGV